jgi:hypothetical protein
MPSTPHLESKLKEAPSKMNAKAKKLKTRNKEMRNIDKNGG